MGYPNIIYGDYGDEKNTYSALPNNNSLGQLMILPDGSKFRLAQAGSATALEAGAILSTTAGLAGDGNVASSGLIASATTTLNAVGDTDVYVATSLTAFTEDQLAGGVINIQGPAASAYIGQVHRIKGNDAAASVAAGGDLKINLELSDPLKVAWKAGTTTISVRKSPYKDAVVMDQGTIIAGPMGVSPVAVSTSYYFWAQRSGLSSIQQSGSACVDGETAYCDTALAGSVTISPATADTSTVVASYDLLVRQRSLGVALEGAVASECVLVQLDLE